MDKVYAVVVLDSCVYKKFSLALARLLSVFPMVSLLGVLLILGLDGPACYHLLIVCDHIMSVFVSG